MVTYSTNDEGHQFLESDGIKCQVFKIPVKQFAEFIKANPHKALMTVPDYSIVIMPLVSRDWPHSIAQEMKDWYMQNRILAYPKQFKKYKLTDGQS